MLYYSISGPNAAEMRKRNPETKTPAAFLAVLFFLAVFAPSAASAFEQTGKLVPEDGKARGDFGYGVAVSEGGIMAGAIRNDGNEEGSGAAYFYEKDSDGEWVLRQKLAPADGKTGDEFGSSVSVSGDTAIIGARRDSGAGTGEGAGAAAYVYERNADGEWVLARKLASGAAGGGDSFGESVSVSGTSAIVGADEDDPSLDLPGAAYVYEKDSDGEWVLRSRLSPGDGQSGDQFGQSVSISGDAAVVGSELNRGNGYWSGAAYVYEKSSSGEWMFRQKLVPGKDAASPTDVLRDRFGHSVSISGDTVIVGSYFDHSAYVYERSPDGDWAFRQKLTPDDPDGGHYFGWSVAVSGKRAVVGAHEYTWRGSFFGPRVDDGERGPGSAYVYEKDSDGAWVLVRKLAASDPGAADRFGWSVAVSDDAAAVGSIWDDDGAENSGSVYVFEAADDASGAAEEGGCSVSGRSGDPGALAGLGLFSLALLAVRFRKKRRRSSGRSSRFRLLSRTRTGMLDRVF